MFRDILRGTSLLMMFKVFAAFFSFASSIIISKVYGIKIYGEYSLIFSIISFFIMINLSGIDLFLIRKINEYQSKATIIAVIIKSVKYFFVIGLILIASFGLTGSFLSKTFFNNTLILPVSLIGFGIFFFSCLKFIGSLYRAHGSLFRYSFNDNFSIQFPLFCLLSYSLYIKKINIHPIWLLYLVLTVAAIVSIFLIIKFLKFHYPSFFLEEYGKPILKYSYPMMLTSSIIYAMSYVDSFMISSYLNNYYVGLYSGIIKLSMPLSFLSGAVSSYLAPKIAKAYNQNQFHLVKKMYLYTIIILLTFGTLIFLVFFFYPTFFLNIFGNEYTSESIAYRIYLVATFISGALFGPIGYFLVMTNHEKTFLKILIAAFLINIVFNFFLIPKYGIKGAAFATLISTLIWKSAGFWKLKKENII